jgi:hypothetical protein
MPKLLKIPTDEEQDDWEQNVLMPSVYANVVEGMKQLMLETEKINKSIEKTEASLAEKRKHGKFINGEYILNSELKKKETKDKTKIIEDVNEMIKNTESKKEKET